MANTCARSDGDALPPDGAFSMDWIKGFPWATQKPKVDAALGLLRSKGAAKLGVMGFCYGGHPCCWASAENSDILAGVVCHPSIQLETFAFGGSCEDLLKSVQCPFLLAPAGNDLPMWEEEGAFGMALKASANGSECAWQLYPEVRHGRRVELGGRVAAIAWLPVHRGAKFDCARVVCGPPQMSHGWSCRGDVIDEKVKRDVDDVMAKAKAFFAQHMQ